MQLLQQASGGFVALWSLFPANLLLVVFNSVVIVLISKLKKHKGSHSKEKIVFTRDSVLQIIIKRGSVCES